MVLQILQYSGVAVFAVAGALAAGRKSLDLLGVIVIATVTAIGGGTLRDLLLDRHPVFWMHEPAYLLVIAVSALLTVPYVRVARPPEKFLQIADALGLALFSVSGAQIAEASGFGGVIAVVMGTITGCFGGVVRDVLCAEIPMILRRGHIYATAAIAGTSLYVILGALDVGTPVAAAAGMLTIVVLRVSAIAFNLQLPVFTIPADRDPS